MIRIDCKQPGEKFVPYWRTCVGAGRANEGLRAVFQRHLALVQENIGFRYVRMHALFHDDMFVMRKDEQGGYIFNFQYIDDLFDMLLEAQVVAINKPGAQASINTPFMRRMMERLDSMSFAAFASDQDFSMGYSWSTEDVLLNSWGTILPRDMYREEDMETILFAESADEAAPVGIEMYVYVVNPYSENIDLAIDYLEARAETMSDGMQATILTDWREPIRDPSFDRMLESYDKMIENRKKALDEAADDQKQAIEDEIKEMEIGRQNILGNEYVWTEEQLAEYRELTEAESKTGVRVHEYGHCIQSLILGPLYLIAVGLPSYLWANLPPLRKLRREKGLSYYSVYPENWANALGEWATKEKSCRRAMPVRRRA